MGDLQHGGAGALADLQASTLSTRERVRPRDAFDDGDRDPGRRHRRCRTLYRIEWSATKVEFYVDGVLEA